MCSYILFWTASATTAAEMLFSSNSTRLTFILNSKINKMWWNPCVNYFLTQFSSCFVLYQFGKGYNNWVMPIGVVA